MYGKYKKVNKYVFKSAKEEIDFNVHDHVAHVEPHVCVLIKIGQGEVVVKLS